MPADLSLSLSFAGVPASSFDCGHEGKSGKGSSMMSMGKSGKGGSMMSMGKAGKGSSKMSTGKSGKGTLAPTGAPTHHPTPELDHP